MGIKNGRLRLKTPMALKPAKRFSTPLEQTKERIEMSIIDKIHECENNLAEAFNRRDIETLISLHTEDCWVLAPGQPLQRGTEAVRAAFEEPLGAGAKNCRFTSEQVVESGDTAYHIGRFAFDIPDEASGETTVTGKYVDGYRLQRDGTCKIQTSSFSFDAE